MSLCVHICVKQRVRHVIPNFKETILVLHLFIFISYIFLTSKEATGKCLQMLCYAVHSAIVRNAGV